MRQGVSYVARKSCHAARMVLLSLQWCLAMKDQETGFNTTGSKGVGTTPDPQLSHDDTVSRLYRPT
jgi:hypothetical protein